MFDRRKCVESQIPYFEVGEIDVLVAYSRVLGRIELSEHAVRLLSA